MSTFATHHFRIVRYALTFLSLALDALAQSAASKAYTPLVVPCPPGASFVRFAGAGPQALGPQEVTYISNRKSSTLPSAWSTYLANVDAYATAHNLTIPNYVHQFLGGSDSTPNGMTVALAASGGSYRATIMAAGVMNALDGRNSTSVLAGTGGLLQGASYLAGLSGSG